HEGQPFLALEWVEGGSLADRLDGSPWPADEAARLVETLAQAIHAAHSQGVIHRDLKPANVLLSGVRSQGPGVRRQESGVSRRQALPPDSCRLTPDSCPKITDFGLARPVEGSGLTQSGFAVGTPAYMAPEQASGDRAAVGSAADVYALGV